MRSQLSPQAIAVRAVLAAKRCHLTADEIISLLPGSSTASVYRALDQLVSRGDVHKLPLHGKSFCYELVREPHTHLICRECKTILDIPLDLTGLIREAARINGCEVDCADTTAIGLCPGCAKKHKDQNSG